MPFYQKKIMLWQRAALVLCLSLGCVVAAWGQDGTISGAVKDKSGAGVSGVTVVATNQVTSKKHRTKSKEGGAFALKVKAGAYRVSVVFPYVAHFPGDGTDPDAVRPEKAYAAEFPKPDDDKNRRMQDNVIVEGGKTTNINIPAEQMSGNLSGEPDPKLNGRPQAPGYTGSPTVDSAPQTIVDRKEIRDRWRVAFPEYDRYGDKGARGRDIPFKRNRWYNPYDQNILKGDRPIFGDDYFMILSGVSTTGVEIRGSCGPSPIRKSTKPVSWASGSALNSIPEKKLMLPNACRHSSLRTGDTSSSERAFSVLIRLASVRLECRTKLNAELAARSGTPVNRSWLHSVRPKCGITSG